MPIEQVYIADFHVRLSTTRLPMTPILCKIYQFMGRNHPHASRSICAAHGKYMHRMILDASIQSANPPR
jgi:hypothetical protein